MESRTSGGMIYSSHVRRLIVPVFGHVVLQTVSPNCVIGGRHGYPQPCLFTDTRRAAGVGVSDSASGPAGAGLAAPLLTFLHFLFCIFYSQLLYML